jgi:peptidoglycan/LPS O-acetylase OafA/YrhL
MGRTHRTSTRPIAPSSNRLPPRAQAAPGCSAELVHGPLTVAPAPGRPTRLDRLTGLRVFAALAVVLVHVGYHFTNSNTVDVAEAYGYTGVTFFYLLSGFVLTWSKPDPRPARFWWSRFSRIWPLTFLLTVFAFTVIAAQERIPGPAGHLANVLLLQAWWPRGSWYFGGNGVSWSLSCEMFFYLLFPLLIIPIRRLGWCGLGMVAAAVLTIQVGAPVLAALLGMPAKIYFWLFFIFPPYRLLEFILGMLLARAVGLGLQLRWPRSTSLLALSALAGVAFACTEYTVSTGQYLDRPFVALAVIPWLMVLLLAAATQDLRRVSSWLRSGVLVGLGESSFALYLVHKPLYLFTSRFGWWQNSGHLAATGRLVLFIGLALGTAAALHRWLEGPLDRLLRRLPDRIHLPRQPQPALLATAQAPSGRPWAPGPPGARRPRSPSARLSPPPGPGGTSGRCRPRLRRDPRTEIGGRPPRAP